MIPKGIFCRLPVEQYTFQVRLSVLQEEGLLQGYELVIITIS